MSIPTEESAAMMVATLSPEALAAFRAVIAITGDDSNLLINALVQAACTVALAAGCAPENFAAGVKRAWDERAEAFSCLPVETTN